MDINGEMGSFNSISFPNDLNRMNVQIRDLFNKLMHNLYPMAKHGAMSGRCEIQTKQMENFLSQNFDFENIPGEYIVQGVKSFKIGKEISSLNNNLLIKFPSEEYENPFEMTIEEILKWQKSFNVYILEKNSSPINKEFVKRALQGQSEEGDEAFQMKFIIRLSTSPILMEFDGKILQRKLNEDWPNKIKLVSVTGVDFAGRIHDINDISTYLINWPDIYHIDPLTRKPFVLNGRDFVIKPNICAQLNEQRLYEDLILMSHLRLYASNQQSVEIVVETGIGLGVFAGQQIGIDHQTRSLSAKAMKFVLEKYGSTYSNIRAIIFAMPIFEKDQSTSTYHYFVETFKNNYSGSIPVLIVDQDMHRLTVYIAKQGFNVSQLNPADSHGVFGEYWQNLGPAVEEKLALTTLGLLIQHHLFNSENILNSDNYKFVPNIQNQFVEYHSSNNKNKILNCNNDQIIPINEDQSTYPTNQMASSFNLNRFQLLQVFQHRFIWICQWIMYIFFFWIQKKH